MSKTYAPKRIETNGRMLPLGDLELYYESYGQGKVLVLLHGFGGCCQNWHPFIPLLSEHYHIINIDLRGHGYSNNPENVFTHQQAAADVFQLLNHLNIHQFSAMGMSTGGMVFLHMAIHSPDRIKAMVLISATNHFPEQARAIMRRTSLETMPLEVKEMYRECAKQGELQIRQLILQFNAFHNNYSDMNLTAESLSAISAKTLLVHGEKDNFFPIEIANTLHQSIHESELWLIPEGDHVPIFNQVERFCVRAIEFLKKAN